MAKSFSTAQAYPPPTRRRAQKEDERAGPWPLAWRLWHKSLRGVRGARPLGFALIPGHASEPRPAPELLVLATRLATLRRVICDAAYAAAAGFALVMKAGARPVVRPNPTHPQPFDRAAYRGRRKIENMWATLKE